ncbi:MAG TPA: hypothetical protein VES20_11030, partial [Bryobacteraceae bacterium]|nr:hypothetical protein [Bryobacteraceae bacterium]
YNALTFRLEKRLSSGLQFLSAYTWAKNLDNVVEDNNEVGGQGALNPYDRRLERARSVNDIRHNWVFSSVYELPFGRGKRWATGGGPRDLLFGGWQVGAIVSVRTGAPFTVVTTGNITNAGGADRPTRLGSGELSSSERTIDRWFDTSAFAVQRQYTYGNSGRNILSGPGLKNLDVSLAKTFSLLEHLDLQFRAEAFNATNTPAFGQPNATLNSPGVGVINSAGDPRRLQLALKLLW